MYFKKNDATIHYEIIGEGEWVILLHGNQEDMSIFQPLLPYLKNYKVLLVDSRGHGKSTGSEITLEKMKEDLIDLINALHISSFYLVGYSDGGNIGLLYALQDQSKLKGLILLGANYHPSGLMWQVRFSIWFFSYFSLNVKTRAMNRLMEKEPKIRKEDLAKINVPTLILLGEHDCIKSTHAEIMYQTIQSSRYEVIKGADHSLLNYQEVHKLIQNFLSKIKPL